MPPRWCSLSRLWRNLRHRANVDRDLDEELRSFVDLVADEHVRRGADETAARRAARIELGGLDAVKDRVRAARAGASLDRFAQDLRYGLRTLKRSPIFALTASLSLAVGIGAATTIIAVANGLLLRAPTGVAEPGQLVDVIATPSGVPSGITPVSYAMYEAIRDRAATLNGVYAYTIEPTALAMNVDGSVDRAFATLVTTEYFQVLGVSPVLGRAFGAADARADADAAVAVLSHDLWMRRFHGDPGVVGRTVRLKNQPFRVVGVAAASFLGTTVVTPDLWLPVSAAPLIGMATATTTDRFNPWLMIGGRLARGATKAQATAEMQVIGRAMRPNGSPDVPRAPADARDVAASSLRWSVESSSPVPFGLRAIVGVFLGLLLAIVSVVLLIASANVAGILLARGAARGREIAVRAAIGASRGRIVRQLLTETMLLGVLGGAVGLLLAHLLTRTSIWLLPATPIPVHVPAALDWRVIIFSFALCLCAALAAGLAPARRVSRTDVVSALRDDSPIPSSHARLRTIFVVVQIALSTMLVVAAGLLVRTVGHVNHIDYGFDARGVVAVTIDGASAGRDAATVGQLVMRFLERAHSVPGTQSVTAADRLPDASNRSVRVGGLHAAGAAEADARPDVVPNWHVVDADYFKTMRIPLLQGREFTADDREGREPVVIVSTSTARQLWPGQNPVGQTLTMSALPTFGRSDSADATRTVVGVAKDLNYGPTGRSAPLDFYVPFRQTPTNVVTVLVRTADENRAIADLRALASTMAADFPPLPVQSLEAMQTGPVQIQLRIATIVTAGVGVIGLFLAILGIHGVTAYVVAQRTKEFGIRIALGADRRDVIAIALRYGMGLVGSGVTIGLVLGAGMGRVLAASPLRTSALDPAVFALAPLLFLVAGLAACYGPARRAGRIDPIMWLRAE